MALRSYDIDYKRLCDDEDMNPIRTQKEAVQVLIGNLFTGNYDELKLCHAIQKLAKVHGVEENFDLDVEELAIQNPAIYEGQRRHFESRIADLKKAVARHLTMLKQEIYGDSEVDMQNVNGAISNLEWICDEEIADKKITIRRA